jgi:hypothetical protein
VGKPYVGEGENKRYRQPKHNKRNPLSLKKTKEKKKIIHHHHRSPSPYLRAAFSLSPARFIRVFVDREPWVIRSAVVVRPGVFLANNGDHLLLFGYGVVYMLNRNSPLDCTAEKRRRKHEVCREPGRQVIVSQLGKVDRLQGCVSWHQRTMHAAQK